MTVRSLPQPGETLRLAEGLSREFLLHRRIAPKRIAEDGTLIIAATGHARPEDLAELGVLYGVTPRSEPASAEEVEQLIERLAHATGTSLELAPEEEEDLTADARNLASQPPVVRFVNLLIREAYDAGASDIHLESIPNGLTVRFRLDGVLSVAPEPPAGLHLAVISRIKLLAQLDIAERRRPQDGRIRIRLEHRELDLRVSAVPTLHGESVVLRLLERGGRPVRLEDLGLEAATLDRMIRLSTRPHGMILATGPTGSGKTTTLYAALSRRNARAEKIITVEEPIEYQLPGITQVPVHRESGTTFATALRAILRQDPDVLMIGEMRDRETAELGIQAAMTGHVVFSTLHTNDAVGAIPRLLDLGVPPFLIAATLHGVLAQRLVRRRCSGCEGAGCPACRRTGFRGRIGLFELLVITDEVRAAIAGGADRLELERLALAQGMRSLEMDGRSKVDAGITTLEEVHRVAEE